MGHCAGTSLSLRAEGRLKRFVRRCVASLLFLLAIRGSKMKEQEPVYHNKEKNHPGAKIPEQEPG